MAFSNLKQKRNIYLRNRFNSREHINSKEERSAFKTGHNMAFNSCLKWILKRSGCQNVNELKKLLDYNFKSKTSNKYFIGVDLAYENSFHLVGKDANNFIENMIKKKSENPNKIDQKFIEDFNKNNISNMFKEDKNE